MRSDAVHFQSLANLAPVFLTVVDMSTNLVIDINDYGLGLLGYQRSEVVGADLRRFVHVVDQRPDEFDPSNLHAPISLERRLLKADGSFMHYTMSARHVPGSAADYLIAGRPVRDVVSADSALGHLGTLAELTADPFLVSDNQGIVRYANEAARKLYGSDAVGAHLANFFHESDTGFEKLLAAYKNETHTARARVTAIDRDGSILKLSVQTAYDPTTKRWFTVERDISELVANEERLATLTAELKRRATTDALTGVANRSALTECIEEATAQGRPLSLLLLDMDDFKSVNDTLGHAAGDEFLQIVARRLSAIAADHGTVGRWGGDEFVMFMPDVDSIAAAAIASEMIESISAPISIGGITLSRSCSIGVAVSDPGDDLSGLLRRADQAAYQAKHAGRSRFKVHDGPSESWPMGTSLLSSPAAFDLPG